MEHQFSDKALTCSDCKREFIFTAGEQLFFHEKQFKNDPKRCKPCKSRRGSAPDAAGGEKPSTGFLLRTETRTDCSECGVETTVPFKPTQGRPVLCRQCFQKRGRAATPRIVPAARVPVDDVVEALTAISADGQGGGLSAQGAAMAATAMESAAQNSSVSSIADLQMLSALETEVCDPEQIPLELISASKDLGAEQLEQPCLAGTTDASARHFEA